MTARAVQRPGSSSRPSPLPSGARQRRPSDAASAHEVTLVRDLVRHLGAEGYEGPTLAALRRKYESRTPSVRTLLGVLTALEERVGETTDFHERIQKVRRALLPAEPRMVGRGMRWPYTASPRADMRAFYHALRPRQRVHYLNSGTAYVRATVVERGGEKMLLPTAFVGRWRAEDMPARWPGGRVHVPHLAQLVLTHEPFKPAPERIYEAAVPGSDAARSSFDPRRAAPIPLRVPAARERSSSSAQPQRPSGRVVLISCAATTTPGRAPVPVEQRYIGPLFRASLRYARSLTGDGNIFCLSVKFGLLSLAQKVGPGDSTLDQLPAAARARWGERVAAEMRDRFGTGARAVVVLAGKLYADALEAAKGSAAWRFEEPMRGMGIYDRSSFLHQHAGAQ